MALYEHEFEAIRELRAAIDALDRGRSKWALDNINRARDLLIGAKPTAYEMAEIDRRLSDSEV